VAGEQRLANSKEQWANTLEEPIGQAHNSWWKTTQKNSGYETADNE
jgi:hypothetical protein